MQIAELVRRSGVPLARVKFYIREGMLPPGSATGARRAEYDESHLERLRLIRSLTTVAGLPLARAKQILDVIDHPEGSVSDMLARAIAALAAPEDPDHTTPAGTAQDYHRAAAALPALGPTYASSDAGMTAFAQLENALRAAEEAGLPVSDARLRVYGEHIAAIARLEIDNLPADPKAAVPYAVLGTAVYEPVLAALRRLAHQNLTVERHSR